MHHGGALTLTQSHRRGELGTSPPTTPGALGRRAPPRGVEQGVELGVSSLPLPAFRKAARSRTLIGLRGGHGSPAPAGSGCARGDCARAERGDTHSSPAVTGGGGGVAAGGVGGGGGGCFRGLAAGTTRGDGSGVGAASLLPHRSDGGAPLARRCAASA